MPDLGRQHRLVLGLYTRLFLTRDRFIIDAAAASRHRHHATVNHSLHEQAVMDLGAAAAAVMLQLYTLQRRDAVMAVTKLQPSETKEARRDVAAQRKTRERDNY